MARMQSVQNQCCCCSMSVFSALFGIIMLSTGICLVLNYRIMEVDTTGLPPELQNEEGKKIVGIILICCGLAGMGLSALVTALYFTVCSQSKTTAVMPSEPAEKHHHHPPSSTDPHSTEVPNHHPQSKHSSRHGKRPKKKRPPPHLKGYRTKLPPHQEDDNENEGRPEQMDLDESSRSLDSSQTGSSKTNSYLGDRKGLDSGDVTETSFQTNPKPPFVIYKPEASSNHVNKQIMLKTKPEESGTASSGEQLLLKVKSEELAAHQEEQVLLNTELQTHPVEEVIHRTTPNGLVSNPRGEPVLNTNSGEMQNHSGEQVLGKSLPPPPIPAKSVTLDSDEEVSQIEEIKQLDKDVANLLV